jgi:hypothetical protein
MYSISRFSGGVLIGYRAKNLNQTGHHGRAPLSEANHHISSYIISNISQFNLNQASHHGRPPLSEANRISSSLNLNQTGHHGRPPRSIGSESNFELHHLKFESNWPSRTAACIGRQSNFSAASSQIYYPLTVSPLSEANRISSYYYELWWQQGTSQVAGVLDRSSCLFEASAQLFSFLELQCHRAAFVSRVCHLATTLDSPTVTSTSLFSFRNVQHYPPTEPPHEETHGQFTTVY